MITSNDCRKNIGCWTCEFSHTIPVGHDVEVECGHTNPDIRNGFRGWETARTCKGYRMKPFTKTSPRKDDQAHE